jgi:hypothetical protein
MIRAAAREIWDKGQIRKAHAITEGRDKRRLVALAAFLVPPVPLPLVNPDPVTNDWLLFVAGAFKHELA